MNHTHLSEGLPPGRVPLSALRAFEAAARRGSFREAAKEIGLTPSAISHHVRDLEAELGTALFHRQHREVTLTEAAARLAASLTPAFTAIAGAYREARRSRSLRLSAAPLFAARFLLPRLGELRDLLPDVTIEVESAIAPVDLASGRHDLALRFGPEPMAPLVAARLGGGGFAIVAAPRLAAQFQSTATFFAECPLLALTRQPDAWSDVFAHLGIQGQRRELLFDSYEGVLRAAEDGLGAAVVPMLVCEDQLARGTLVKVIDRIIDNGWCYWLIGRPNVLPASQLKRLADWLTDCITSRDAVPQSSPSSGASNASASASVG
ncbi:LysR substrate-binding domain-containing protein [Erythrobacter sp. NE805]|uniref:LysR substrate-binding domain-containing protein n=1 Tax=Erythrobacter sp. NE805 TaxID=3389875 RepID=UPI00396AF570